MKKFVSLPPAPLSSLAKHEELNESFKSFPFAPRNSSKVQTFWHASENVFLSIFSLLLFKIKMENRGGKVMLVIAC